MEIDIDTDRDTEAFTYESAAEVLKALGHPVRLQILRYIMNSPKQQTTVMEMVSALGIHQATASQHLKMMKSYNILESRRFRTSIIYRVRESAIKNVIKTILRDFLPDASQE